MDLNEHALNEAQRTLKRLGVTHVLTPPQASSVHPSAPSSYVKSTPQTGFSTPGSLEPKLATAAEDSLPPLLRALFHGKHAPIRTMWTYAGFYEDMQVTPAPARLVVFKKIQESATAHLKWSPGDIGTWPLDVEPNIFRMGIEYFRPKTILSFCAVNNPAGQLDEGVHSLLKQAGCRVITLPNLEQMAQGNQQLKNEAWKILQSVPQ